MFIAKTTILLQISLMTDNTSRPFEDALEDLRISGSVLLHDTYEPPWAVDIPGEPELQKLMAVGPDMRVVPFHLVLAGSFNLSQPGRGTTSVKTNEVAICPGGEPHRMSYGKSTKAVPLARILTGRATPGPLLRRNKTASNATSLLCGVFVMRKSPLNPMLSALPAVLRVSTAGESASPMLARVAEMLSLEVESGLRDSFTASRLLEVFCAEALRKHSQTPGNGRPGWFQALNDARIGEALAHFHKAPGEPWSVSTLAETVAISPSRFAARFRELTGESVMIYVTRWRMNVACKMLRETDNGLDQIALEVGYQNTPAFSRAFKAIVGQSPARWRSSLVE